MLSLDLLRRRSAGARAPAHLQPPRAPEPLTAPAAVGPARGSCCAGRRAGPGARHLRQRQRGAHGGRVGGGHAGGDQQAPGRGLRRVPTRRPSATRVGPRLAARAGSATGLPGYSDAFLACFLREHKGDTQVGPFFSYLPSLPHRPQSSLLIRFCSMLREKSMNTIAGSGVTT